ncbi:hypothetical protein niasHS_006357 [Heterodera schachtii]|uniref:Uncharacterized protein n=1 Tax=Heterodera schachtii TaxID=97005 RepID=A0ABD2JWK8_HETSC
MATEQMEMDVSTDDNDGAPSRADIAMKTMDIDQPNHSLDEQHPKNAMLRAKLANSNKAKKTNSLVAVLSRVEDKLQDQKEKLSQMEKNQQQMEKNLHHFAVQIEHLQNGQMALFKKITTEVEIE